jgi:membrane protein implicated in regulation of membrane protease activity
MATPRLMIVVAGAAALVIAAIAVLAFGTWWALAIALAAHALGTLIVVGYALQRANQDDGKPDPMAEARIEEQARQLKERRRKTGQINPAKDYEVF